MNFNMNYKELKLLPYLFFISIYSFYLLSKGIYVILLWTLILSLTYILMSNKLLINKYIAKKYVFNQIIILLTLINILWILSYDSTINNFRWFFFLILITLVELFICYLIDLIKHNSKNELENTLTEQGYCDPNVQLSDKNYLLYVLIIIYFVIIFFIGFRLKFFNIDVENLKVLIRQLVAAFVTVLFTIVLHEKIILFTNLSILEKKKGVPIKTYLSKKYN